MTEKSFSDSRPSDSNCEMFEARPIDCVQWPKKRSVMVMVS